jgi:hypothetical protein
MGRVSTSSWMAFIRADDVGVAGLRDLVPMLR